MLKLCGFNVSSYYNKVKLSMLEKSVPFEEELVLPRQEESVLKQSPMGRVPFLRTDRGVLTESQVIVEYVEEAYRDVPLYPADPFERAKCREIIQHLELDVELPARRLFGEAFFGGKASDETRREVEKQLGRGLRSLAQLAKFSPYIAGERFTHADCAAGIHLPMVAQATRIIYNRDFVAELLPGAIPYLDRLRERPAVRRVEDDRKAALAAYEAAQAKKKS